MANGTISEKCEELYDKLNSFVTSVISRDVTPKISNLNTEVWGSNTQTGDSRIDDLETDVTSLNNSITNLEIDTGWVEMTINSSNWQKGSGNGCWYRRKGNNVTVTINVVGTKTFSDTAIICTIPSSIAPTHRLEYGGATNNLTFGGFIETNGTIIIRRPYLGGTGTNWSTSTWVGFSFSYVL